MIVALVGEGDREHNWEGAVFANRYQVEARIGSGASATVYRARHMESATAVALKISRPYVLTKTRRAARFLREVQAVQRIDHEGCVRILDWGIEDECAFIAMELIVGDDLFDVVRREAPIAEARAVAIIAAICDVLEAAHALGVVHRDLKPRNVMLSHDGARAPKVKVLDFGLAKLLRAPVDEDSTLPLELTRPGSVLGTPHYMAPEQVRGASDIDGRADLYALSVMLYEMLTARRPLEERNAVRALIALGSALPTPPSEHVPGLDQELEKLVLRGLEKEPEARFASAAEMARQLRELMARLADDDNLTQRVARREPAPATDSGPSPSDDDSSDEVATRVVAAGTPSQAPRMVAKTVKRAPRQPASDHAAQPPRAPGPDPRLDDMQTRRSRKEVAPPPPDPPTERQSDVDEHVPTVVMKRNRDATAPALGPASSISPSPPSSPVSQRSPSPPSSLGTADTPPPPSTPTPGATRHALTSAPDSGPSPTRSTRRRARERSEAEKGIRAALVTITIAALTAALGRWLALW